MKPLPVLVAMATVVLLSARSTGATNAPRGNVLPPPTVVAAASPDALPSMDGAATATPAPAVPVPHLPDAPEVAIVRDGSRYLFPIPASATSTTTPSLLFESYIVPMAPALVTAWYAKVLPADGWFVDWQHSDPTSTTPELNGQGILYFCRQGQWSALLVRRNATSGAGSTQLDIQADFESGSCNP